MIVEFLMPAAIDDPSRPSGGNIYDRRIGQGLTDLGWQVRRHLVAGDYPTPTDHETNELANVLGGLPDGSLVLIDGLLASCSPELVQRAAVRLRLAVLVHLPLGVEGRGQTIATRERAALASARALVTTSGWTAGWLRDHYGLADQVRVAAPGVDTADVAESSSDGGRLLCVGAVAPHKGQDVLVAALTLLAARGHLDLDWHCWLVGAEVDDDYARLLRAAITSAGLDGRVELAGPMPEEALSAVYAETDLLVVPSRTETYGMVVLEALAHGIPVVAAAVGGLPSTVGLDLAGDGPGLLVGPDDPGQLADALQRWLDDQELRSRTRSAALARRQVLRSWSTTAEEIADALASLAA